MKRLQTKAAAIISAGVSAVAWLGVIPAERVVGALLVIVVLIGGFLAAAAQTKGNDRANQ